ncbi:unnamed protein product, partial [Trichobilharzia regenti]
MYVYNFRPESEDIHTAYALSLSMEEEVKRRKSEAILGEKILPTDLGPPEHLLLSREKRENIFAQKLESILLEVSVAFGSPRSPTSGFAITHNP